MYFQEKTSLETHKELFMPTILTKDLFSQMKNELCGVEREYVPITDEVGVYATQLTVGGAVALAEMGMKEANRIIINWVVAGIVDEDFNPVFTPEDVERMPHNLAKKLAQALFRVNKLITPTTVNDAEKNSEGEPS